MKRAEFLTRIATRLGRAPGAPPSARSQGHSGTEPCTAGEREQIAQGRAESLAPQELAARFALELERVGGTCLSVATCAELVTRLEALRSEHGAVDIVSWHSDQFRRFELASWFESAGVREPRVNAGRDADEAGGPDGAGGGDAGGEASTRGIAAAAPVGARDADLEYLARCAQAHWGLTTVHAAVAATGSIVLACSGSRPRATSLLPGVHVALVAASQLVPRMADLSEFGSGASELPSQLLFVTGPSRTSDIENDLTIGVHGPAAVVVFVVGSL